MPDILVVGDREVESGAVGVRERGEDKGAAARRVVYDLVPLKSASGGCPRPAETWAALWPMVRCARGPAG